MFRRLAAEKVKVAQSYKSTSGAIQHDRSFLRNMVGSASASNVAICSD